MGWLLCRPFFFLVYTIVYSKNFIGGFVMHQHTYYILDSEGYRLLTVVSQNTSRSFDDEAEFLLSPLLPLIAAQYGLDKVVYC